MQVLVYEIKDTPGVVYQECGFDRYADKRKEHLRKQDNIDHVLSYRGAWTIRNFWWCLIRATRVSDNRPASPQGEYRIG